jgi:predicted TIM-barrel fold metal-dependent hydrolase
VPVAGGRPWPAPRKPGRLILAGPSRWFCPLAGGGVCGAVGLPVAQRTGAVIGPIVDGNVHLWDQRDNPVFWLSDRSLLRDMLGDYDSLPDRYTLSDYRRETAGFDVRGVVWSDAVAADPLAAADWVSRQDGTPPVIAMVSLGDPMSAAFADLARRCQQRPLIRSIRMRLVPGLSGRAAGGDVLENQLVRDNLALLARSGLVTTVESRSWVISGA